MISNLNLARIEFLGNLKILMMTVVLMNPSQAVLIQRMMKSIKDSIIF